MEARLGTEAHHFYSLNPADLRAVGKSSMEWSMNDWKWDGDLFFASPLNAVATSRVGSQFLPIGAGIPIAPGNSSNSSSSCSDEVNLGTEKGKRELEKKRRVIVVEDDNLDEEARNLTLKLGGHGFPISEREVGNGEGSSGKKTKLGSNNLGRAICQVEDCGADLSNAKDYHRRHKVCEMHSKATKALVGSVMQRFCQQCSRFHVLQEFDEGKRSCRRRLAGHNKRRRKTNPEIAANANSSNDDQTNSYLLLSLLKILSNMHSNRSDQTADQDLLSHLLRSLASRGVENGARNMSGLQRSQDAPNGGPSNAHSELVSALFSNVRGAPEPFKQHLSASVAGMQEQGLCAHGTKDSSAAQTRMNSFDLNDAYIDSDDGVDDTEKSPVLANPGISSLDCPSWIQQDSHQSSPPQTSGNSESASAQSPSSSSGDGQSRTDRIVFKLFGKEPGDFPLVLRSQILDWLAHSPTDIESYIRPGCVVLTIYLRQAVAAWEELCCDLSFSLSRLLDCSEDDFWRNGWVYIKAQHQIAFVYNGQVLVDTSLPVRSDHYTRIICVKPIATPSTDKANFSVKGINLCQPATKLLCAVEGKYLLEEATHDLMDSIDNAKEHDEIQSINFSCSIPHIYGRGFIEIEDHGFSSTFFPFIVAEEEVCSEIRMLESVLESTEVDADGIQTGRFEVRSQAMDFIHEIGWLLHRCQVKARLGPLNPCTDLFPLRRFKSLMEFSMDHEWCATVKKLLNILLEGTVGSGEHPNLKVALIEMGLLHRAVRKNSRPLVEVLLMFAPHNLSEILGSEGADVAHRNNYLFRPDAVGPAGLTPLHIAAGKDDSEEVLDALLDDPQKVGVEAWKSAHDSTGSTPEDYARLRGHYSYIHLVQRKITRKPTSGHVVVDIPGAPSDNSTKQKEHTATTASSFDIVRPSLRSGQLSCKVCDQKLAYRYGPPSRSLVYRPAMLSMVAIAAVCVCVALLFKSCPEVVYMFRPFRWEMLKYGTI